MLPGVDALKPKFAQVRQLAALFLRPSLCFLPCNVLGFAWQPDQVVLRPALRVENDPGVVLARSEFGQGDGYFHKVILSLNTSTGITTRNAADLLARGIDSWD